MTTAARSFRQSARAIAGPSAAPVIRARKIEGKDEVVAEGEELVEQRVHVALQVGHHGDPRRAGNPRRTDHCREPHVVHEEHARGADDVFGGQRGIRADDVLLVEEDGARLRRRVHEDGGVKRPRPGAAHEVPQRHPFRLEREMTNRESSSSPSGAGVVAGTAHPAGGHERRAREAAGVPLLPLDGTLRVGPRELVEEEKVVHGDRAEAENIQAFTRVPPWARPAPFPSGGAGPRRGSRAPRQARRACRTARARPSPPGRATASSAP